MENQIKTVNTPKHDFKNIAEARSWAKKNITGEYQNEDTGQMIKVSNAAIEKYLSEKAIKKSINLDTHFSALKTLPQIIETSMLQARRPDRDNDPNIVEIQRFYGKIYHEGGIYPVKTTIKVIRNEGNNAYSYEVMKIETPEKGAWDRAFVP